MRYFLELSYQGTAYHGWQRQSNARSVQQTLEERLSTLLRHQIDVTGAGRTDTGVHAAYYVAHFDAGTPIDDPEEFCYHLNAVLPGDIAVRTVTAVPDDAHARFDAREREYTYYIQPYKDPFCRQTAWQYYIGLDLEAMNRAAALLERHGDFTTFSKLHSNNGTFICRVMHACWRADAEGELSFTIRADRFLRNMVRSIVGTLVDVGRGKLTVDQFQTMLEACDRSQSSGSAPAHGLFLTDILYPETIFTRTKRST